ncbi:MAG: polysaccharide deacetylase family protein [Rhodoglobus sp.]
MSDRFVLMYHRVCERGPQTRCWFERGTAVTPAALDLHLTWLGQRFDVVPLADLAESTSAGDRARVALTFDDGYADTLEVAAPICARHGVTAACFACAGPPVQGTTPWFDTWYTLVHAGLDRPDWSRIVTHLGFPPALDLAACVVGPPKQWLANLRAPHRDEVLARLAHTLEAPLLERLQLDLEGLRRLRAHGWRIGGHGVDHVRLADSDAETVDRELDGSLRLLADLGETGPPLFAYPDGSWSASVVDTIGLAGFAVACTTDPGPWTADTHRLLVPRLFCRGDAPSPHHLLGDERGKPA